MLDDRKHELMEYELEITVSINVNIKINIAKLLSFGPSWFVLKVNFRYYIDGLKYSTTLYFELLLTVASNVLLQTTDKNFCIEIRSNLEQRNPTKRTIRLAPLVSAI